MSGRELFDLVRASRLAQVAKPKPNSKIRTINSSVPTHQIIFTPAESASRSNYGLKSTLPNKIGVSHISYNDLDNKYSMPDVERNSGHHYNQLIYQELGIPLKQNQSSQLFPNGSNKSLKQLKEANLINYLNLPNKSKLNDILSILKQNKHIYKQFQHFLIERYPKVIMQKKISDSDGEIVEILKQFLQVNDKVIKNEITMENFSSVYSKFNTNTIQGTGGFSYNQKGRLNNTPNGIKHGFVAPGRLVNPKDAAIGGFISSVSDRSVALQLNYSRNAPGKHSRQFKVPLKINDVEIADNGSIRMTSEGITLGKWMETDERYTKSSTDFSGPNARYKEEENATLEQLLNLILK